MMKRVTELKQQLRFVILVVVFSRDIPSAFHHLKNEIVFFRLLLDTVAPTENVENVFRKMFRHIPQTL